MADPIKKQIPQHDPAAPPPPTHPQTAPVEERIPPTHNTTEPYGKGSAAPSREDGSV